ncbi:MAG: Enoyl-CoA hydratase [Caulobacter sp.]|nr:Enoyl-CoA hydratase [Caulobacter sp.]
MTHAFEDLTVEIRQSVGWIIIDRGDGRNALRPGSLKEICIAMDRLTGDDAVRAIVLSGAGKHFSAGADFAFLQDLAVMPGMAIKSQIYEVFQGAARRLYHCPKPTVAAINGAAVTVGCELSLACDFRLVSPTAVFQESWIRLGLMPPLGGLYLLPRMVGLSLASEMALRGRAVNAEEAVRIGLASEQADDAADLAARAQALALELAGLPPLAYRSVKEAMHRGLDASMEGEWSANVLNQSLLLGTDDFKEGLAAVMERRPGQFTGR